MSSVIKGLFLNPPPCDKFDSGGGARWPATCEIKSHGYLVGVPPGSRPLNAPPPKVSQEMTVRLPGEYDFLVLFISAVGFEKVLRLVRHMKEAKPDPEVVFVGRDVQTRPTESLRTSSDLDFVVRGEFDYAVVEFAGGKALDHSAGVSFRKNGGFVHNPARPGLETEELVRLLFATEVYKRNLTIENTTIPFSCNPSVVLHRSRLSRAMHFLLRTSAERR